MTDQEINIAVAECCGIPRGTIDRWLDYTLAERQFQHAEISIDEYYQRHLRLEPNCIPRIPNYCHDLNAMQEAERLIPESERYGYCQWLMKLQAPHRSTGHMENTWLAVTATARQRAEAFLRTVGKYETH